MVQLVDQMVATVIVPLAIVIFLSGLDDLFLTLLFLVTRLRAWRQGPAERPVRGLEPHRIAIYIPCWHEAGVIGNMVEHNLSVIDYPHFDIFIGGYLNDHPTLTAARELEKRFPSVHLAVVPHDGPTSKADCLNWIYQRMLLYEEEKQLHYDVIMTHDAEDLIHPDALGVIDRYSNDYDMVQVPVLPLPTPFWKLTHGVYCDEFAEFQCKDMRVRGDIGSFIPSNGVGTGFSREALERLADSESNRIFEPACLTEDYENGLRLHQLGRKQIFVPLQYGSKGLIATRAFFPATARTAIRQRTRWVTGIALQTWERHGWRGKASQVYWFWRDRKGLLANPLSLLANLAAMAGLSTWLYAHLMGIAWGLPRLSHHGSLLLANLGLLLLQTTVRMSSVAWIYGVWFALGVPVRTVWGNWINGAASICALDRYLRSRLSGKALAWGKTEHAYPTRSALVRHKRPLGEILVGAGWLTAEGLQEALEACPAGMRLGEHLVGTGAISEDALYQALSVQQSLPAGPLEATQVDANISRALPRQVMRRYRVLPFRVAEGVLFLASPEIPTDELQLTLRGFTRMTLRFRLVTPTNFRQLTHAMHALN